MNSSLPTQETRDLSFEPVDNSNPSQLTAEQIAFYNENGYVRPLPIFDAEEARHWQRYFDSLLAKLRDLNDGRDAYAINGYQTTCRGIYDIVTDTRI